MATITPGADQAPTVAPPGPIATTTNGQLQAGYVWLDPRVGWVWQDNTGTISAADQNRYAASQTEIQKGQGGQLTQQADGTWGFTMAYDTGPQQLPAAGRNFPGWGWSEQQIQAAVEKSGQQFGGYTTMQTWDNAGNPITVIGVTQPNGREGFVDANGNVQWNSVNYNVEERAASRYAAANRVQQGEAGPGQGGTPEQRDAYARMQQVLGDYGLQGLDAFTWQAIINGDSQERILQNLRNTDIYKDRFKGMAIRKAAGLRAISENEYLDYERSVRQLMAEAGMPADMWDSPDDYANLIGKDLSIRELTKRTQDLFVAATQAPLEVQQMFNDYFGIDGTHALAMYFMNPEKALPTLEMQLNEAQIGGTAKRFGIGVGLDRAEQVARLGLQPNQYEQRFAQISAISPLFAESVTEGTDLTDVGTGIESVFMGTPGATKQIEQRASERSAVFQGGGGAALTSQGALGLQQER